MVDLGSVELLIGDLAHTEFILEKRFGIKASLRLDIAASDKKNKICVSLWIFWPDTNTADYINIAREETSECGVFGWEFREGYEEEIYRDIVALTYKKLDREEGCPVAREEIVDVKYVSGHKETYGVSRRADDVQWDAVYCWRKAKFSGLYVEAPL